MIFFNKCLFCLFILHSYQIFIIFLGLYLIFKFPHLLHTQHIFERFSIGRIFLQQIKQKIRALLFNLRNLMVPLIKSKYQSIVESWRVTISWLANLHPVLN